MPDFHKVMQILSDLDQHELERLTDVLSNIERAGNSLEKELAEYKAWFDARRQAMQ